ncbi:MAG: hypothetical protein DRP58_12695 [Spirochaetes bacterium]|nr:MAG: hypothetical protein DRP58_12695 [Spirochaetota bacterium]
MASLGVLIVLAFLTQLRTLGFLPPGFLITGSLNIANAFQYTNKGSITFILDVTADHETAIIRVLDTGIGISPDSVNEIFKRFVRLPEAQTLRKEGLGIGLFMVQQIVALHNGSISINSEHGRGSEFIIRLPLLSTGSPASKEITQKPTIPSGIMDDLIDTRGPIGGDYLSYNETVTDFSGINSYTIDRDLELQLSEQSTIFEDDFNRDNSANNDLGSNWSVMQQPGDIMKIVSNEVDISTEWGCAAYKDPISSNATRTTVKIRTKAEDMAAADFQLIIRAYIDVPAGYMARYEGVSIGEGSENRICIYNYNNGTFTELASVAYTLATDTEYIFDFIADNSNLTFKLRNSDYIIIKTITATDSSYSNGKVLISASNDFYFDDFKIENYE